MTAAGKARVPHASSHRHDRRALSHTSVDRLRTDPIEEACPLRFKNTSRYSDDETLELVSFALEGIDHSRVAVHLKNSRQKYRGRAYDGVPAVSPASRDPDVKWLVTLGLGAPGLFPADNLVQTARWSPVRGEPGPADVLRRAPRGRFRGRLERRVISTHAYGGKSSPQLALATWREALVVVAAHEGRHVWQFQSSTPRSEVDAEHWGAERLAAFRRAGAPSDSAAQAIQSGQCT